MTIYNTPEAIVIGMRKIADIIERYPRLSPGSVDVGVYVWGDTNHARAQFNLATRELLAASREFDFEVTTSNSHGLSVRGIDLGGRNSRVNFIVSAGQDVHQPIVKTPPPEWPMDLACLLGSKIKGA